MKQFKTHRSTKEAWKLDDDWSEVKEKEERKKRQNRLNQRAYRKRKEPKEFASGKKLPFRVERFRTTYISPPIVKNISATKERPTEPLSEAKPHR
ncbi:hypothetical protein HYFRA_00008010 [Hymenoscyphus fraxineus]|uniref:Uncharacterized protein n=1 Tax=Hymenoscyphus fraxineus TaxID=746836 RepID=A0A9N9PLL0_9HELO|nr:hypothetical protein HYFRA_00008010 [Hymenoscyphus fraxineus]